VKEWKNELHHVRNISIFEQTKSQLWVDRITHHSYKIIHSSKCDVLSPYMFIKIKIFFDTS
jgi:hypothetical protein